MSLQNVEMVRHVYEAGLIDRDPEELLKLATPEIEYVNPPYAVEPGVAAGSPVDRASIGLARRSDPLSADSAPGHGIGERATRCS
jgi:hypothetical protein